MNLCYIVTFFILWEEPWYGDERKLRQPANISPLGYLITMVDEKGQSDDLHLPEAIPAEALYKCRM